MTARESLKQPAEQVVIYDGTCRLCNAWVRFLLAHHLPRHLRFAPVQSQVGAELLKKLGQSPDDVRTIVLIDGQQHWFRSQAIFRTFRELPWPWRIFSWLRWLPAPLADAVYNLVARNRYRWFGRYDTTHPLIADYPGRFLDKLP